MTPAMKAPITELVMADEGILGWGRRALGWWAASPGGGGVERGSRELPRTPLFCWAPKEGKWAIPDLISVSFPDH